MPEIIVPAADDLVALNAVAEQAGLSVEYRGSVRNAIDAVATAGGVALDYAGSDRNAIEILAGLLGAGEQYVLRLDDDGTLAGQFGSLLLPTYMPHRLTAEHGFTDTIGDFARRYLALPAIGGAVVAVPDALHAFQVVVDGVPEWPDYDDLEFRQVALGACVALVGHGGQVLGGWNAAVYARYSGGPLEPELEGVTVRAYSSEYGPGNSTPIMSAPLVAADGHAVIGMYVDTATGRVGMTANGQDFGFFPGVAVGPVAEIMPGLICEEQTGNEPFPPFTAQLEMMPTGITEPVPAGALDCYGKQV